MRTVMAFLIAIVVSASAHAEMKSKDDQIMDLLRRYAQEVKISWIGATIEPTMLMQESERHWKKYMDLFVANLREQGLEPTPDIIASKQKGFDGWRLKREVFLHALATNPDLRLCRFDGGEDNPCGYVLLERGKPRLALTVRINRPDPNIGNVRLPFP